MITGAASGFAGAGVLISVIGYLFRDKLSSMATSSKEMRDDIHNLRTEFKQSSDSITKTITKLTETVNNLEINLTKQVGDNTTANAELQGQINMEKIRNDANEKRFDRIESRLEAIEHGRIDQRSRD